MASRFVTECQIFLLGFPLNTNPKKGRLAAPAAGSDLSDGRRLQIPGLGGIPGMGGIPGLFGGDDGSLDDGKLERRRFRGLSHLSSVSDVVIRSGLLRK